MSDTLYKGNENEKAPPTNNIDDGEPQAAPPSEEVAEEQPEPTAVTVDSQFADAVLAELEKLHIEVGELRELFVGMQDCLANIEKAMYTTANQVSFLPPQVRMLGGKIEGLTTSISEPRYRAVILSLLGVYDLVDQVLRTLPPAPESDADAGHRRNYEVMRTQLRQILEANGLSEIPADGDFEPKVHRALQNVPVDNPAQANRVLEVVRPGFRTEQSILRYAEVLVGQYVPPEDATDEDKVTGEDTETEPRDV
ncbi:MAG: nucleotide exchange factor GrpE [Candidatus Zixiibacteriota bacterium]